MESAAKKTPLPISNKKVKLSLIHIAKKDVGITDEDYRSLLSGAAEVESAAELEYEYQFNAVMKAFENLGFKSARRGEAGKKTRPRWTDAWGGTPNQRAKIEVMWRTCARNPADKALRVFIKRITHVDHPRFLNSVLAQKVIIALEVMMRKAGFDPVTGRRLV
ncbi:MAG: regulatory protein GemA [Treponema sp.]|jgi:hypothetical protein|nr:regulatory protein GemA [Treponema sp.]